MSSNFDRVLIDVLSIFWLMFDRSLHDFPLNV